mmetsp:Transcript_38211/g.82813  ORF Transcript_38211/g.82813 Transcript_38211/m.82813 type:complete len:98 (+) Transcript_38211:115-408(+)
MFQSDQLQELFYEKFDKSREEVFGAYRAVSKVVWNGNQVKGDQAIATFLRTLPESEHRLTSMDCQPIHSTFTNVTSLTLGQWPRWPNPASLFRSMGL